jgi:NAD(P)-dependent dehydrogenase (short-subunit alcohol dehydrogenase family)
VPAPEPTTFTAIVTGGASGLGAAVCRAIGARGDRAICLDRNAPPPGTAFSHHLVDLADSKDAEGAVLAALDEVDHLDAVVTCAGVDAPGPFATTESEVWERVVAVNLLGTAAVVRAALPALEATGGTVLTVASTLGHRALPDATAYCASKFGVVGFTRALMAELGGRVRVTLCTPGGMATAFFDGRDEQYRPPADARLCDPDHVANAIVATLLLPDGCEVRELVVTSPTEPSWP